MGGGGMLRAGILGLLWMLKPELRAVQGQLRSRQKGKGGKLRRAELEAKAVNDNDTQQRGDREWHLTNSHTIYILIMRQIRGSRKTEVYLRIA
jgi:hypothetical protein